MLLCRPITPWNSTCDGWPWRVHDVDESWGPAWSLMNWGDVYADPGPSPAGNAGPYPKVARPYPGDYRDDGATFASRHRVYSKRRPGCVVAIGGSVRTLISVTPAPVGPISQAEAERAGFESSDAFAYAWHCRYGTRPMQWVWRGCYRVAVPPLWWWRYELAE